MKSWWKKKEFTFFGGTNPTVELSKTLEISMISHSQKSWLISSKKSPQCIKTKRISINVAEW